MKQPSMGSQDVATPQEFKTYSRLVWTRAQDANTHGSVYGGWLLRASIESAVIAIQKMIGKALPLSRSFPKSRHRFASLPPSTRRIFKWRTF